MWQVLFLHQKFYDVFIWNLFIIYFFSSVYNMKNSHSFLMCLTTHICFFFLLFQNKYHNNFFSYYFNQNTLICVYSIFQVTNNKAWNYVKPRDIKFYKQRNFIYKKERKGFSDELNETIYRIRDFK